MGRQWGRAVAFVSISCAIAVAACVGDEPATSSGDDGGGSQSGDAAAGQDTSTSADGSTGGDGAIPTTCDPNAAFGTPAPVDELNTIGNSEEPRLSSDGLVIYFSAEKPDAGGDYDLYSAQRAAPSGPFSNLTKIASAMAPNFVEGSPSLSGDGFVLYYAGMSTAGDGFAIYTITRTSLAQSFIAAPKYLGLPIDATGDAGPFANNGDPFIREDNAELYFASSRNGSFHIFRAATTADGGFTTVDRVSELDLGAGVFLQYPVLSPDGLVIYFAADASADGGVKSDYDIFMGSRSTASGPFSNIHSVSDLNSVYDDYPGYVSRDYCTMYLHRRQTAAVETIYRAVKTP